MFILISGAPTAEQHPKSLPFYSKSDDLLKTYNHKMPALLIFHLCAPHHTHSMIMNRSVRFAEYAPQVLPASARQAEYQVLTV